MDSHNQPPSYEESERQAREEAAAALREAMQSPNNLPPSYEMSEREQYYNQMNLRMQGEIEQRRAGNFIPSAPPAPSPEDLERWYLEDLQAYQQEELRRQYIETLRNQERYDQLQSQIQSQRLRDALERQRKQALDDSYCERINLAIDDYLLMQFMMRDMPILIEYSWRLNLYILEGIYHVGRAAAPVVIDLIGSGISGASSLFGSGSGSGSGGSSDDNPLVVALVAIAAFVAMALSAVVAGYYATKKAVASIANILHGEKIVRSTVRLATIGAGIGTGIYGGMVVGAVLGSVIPGFGSVAGAILGGFLGGLINAGIGAALAKYGMRMFSFVLNENEFNPTNPDKYRLSKKQKLHLANNGVTNTSRINSMLKRVKENKPKKWFFATDENAMMNSEYNGLLKAVKTNPVVSERGVYFGKNNLFFWNGNNWNTRNLQRPPAYNPLAMRA